MASRLYGIVWRWHFLLGVLSVPIIVVIALSGALYAFEPELSTLSDDRTIVSPSASPAVAVNSSATYTFTLDDAVRLAASEKCVPSAAYLPSRRDRAWIIYCLDGEHRVQIIDPYTQRLVGLREGHSWLDIVFDIHWELLLGKPGRWLIEWGTSLTVVLLFTGVYLWWPRGKRRTGGVWYPRRELKARQWLRDLHSVIGAYMVPVLFVVAATGLMWTLFAGDKRWHHLAEDEVHDVFENPPQSTVPEARGPRISLAQAMRGANYDRATDPRALYMSFLPPVPPTAPAAPAKDPASAPYNLYLYDDLHYTPWVTQSVYVDAFDGRMLTTLSFGDRSVAGKIDTLRYSLHVGSILGLPGRILVCLASLILVALCVTGPWMWWKRRAKGTLGAPPRSKRIAWGLWAGLGVLGLMLPLFGYTLLAIVVFEGARWLRARSSAAS